MTELEPITRLFEEVWNQQRLDLLDSIIASHCVINPGPAAFRGIAGFRELVAGFLQSFPDVRHHIEEHIIKGNQIAVRWTGTGTHEGVFMDLAPTQRTMHYWGITLFRVESGKITEAWVVADMLGLLNSLRGPDHAGAI